MNWLDPYLRLVQNKFSILIFIKFLPKDLKSLSQLMGRLFQRLHRENLWDTFYRTEMRLLPLLSRMELTGVTLDVASLNSMGRILAAEAAKIEVEAHSLAAKEFNLASSKQVPVPYKRRKIKLIEGNAKCHLKKFTYKVTLRQCLSV
jgi:DNA polymerase I-like protein with 3'-5' exonuclease and polymerase domains